MAKRKKKSKAASRLNGGKKVTKRSRPIIVGASPPSDDEDVDGCDCVCHDNEAIADSDLPAAIGGIEVKSKSKPRRAAA